MIWITPDHLFLFVMISKKNRSIIIFGILMALLLVILEFSEYRYFVGRLSTEIYTMVIASLFTIVGVWIGYNFLKKKSETAQLKSLESEEAKIKKLNLNKREFEVLQYISQGLSNQEIADELFLALPTIKTHISSLYSKLDVKSRTQAIHKARSIELIS